MGLRTPLPDTPSLPIGADEVTVLDHTVAYATFANAGRAVVPHAVMEVRNTSGDLIWRFDRDGRKPQQVLSPQVAADMNVIMNKVVEEGTARRAIIDGIKSAGKTGTTNAYRDAWFVGYTGNFVCGVWYGNDDYAPLNRMTGGSLPAMTWRAAMVAAHQGVELKSYPRPYGSAFHGRSARRSGEGQGRRGAHSGLDAAGRRRFVARRASDGRCHPHAPGYGRRAGSRRTARGGDRATGHVRVGAGAPDRGPRSR